MISAAWLTQTKYDSVTCCPAAIEVFATWARPPVPASVVDPCCVAAVPPVRLKSTGAAGSLKNPARNCLVPLLNAQMLTTAADGLTNAAMFAIGVPRRRRHDDVVAAVQQRQRRVRARAHDQDA